MANFLGMLKKRWKRGKIRQSPDLYKVTLESLVELKERAFSDPGTDYSPIFSKLVKEFFQKFFKIKYHFTYEEIITESKKARLSAELKSLVSTLLENINSTEYGNRAAGPKTLLRQLQSFEDLVIKLSYIKEIPKTKPAQADKPKDKAKQEEKLKALIVPPPGAAKPAPPAQPEFIDTIRAAKDIMPNSAKASPTPRQKPQKVTEQVVEDKSSAKADKLGGVYDLFSKAYEAIGDNDLKLSKNLYQEIKKACFSLDEESKAEFVDELSELTQTLSELESNSGKQSTVKRKLSPLPIRPVLKPASIHLTKLASTPGNVIVKASPLKNSRPAGVQPKNKPLSLGAVRSHGISKVMAEPKLTPPPKPSSLPPLPKSPIIEPAALDLPAEQEMSPLKKLFGRLFGRPAPEPRLEIELPPEPTPVESQQTTGQIEAIAPIPRAITPKARLLGKQPQPESKDIPALRKISTLIKELYPNLRKKDLWATRGIWEQIQNLKSSLSEETLPTIESDLLEINSQIDALEASLTTHLEQAPEQDLSSIDSKDYNEKISKIVDGWKTPGLAPKTATKIARPGKIKPVAGPEQAAPAAEPLPEKEPKSPEKMSQPKAPVPHPAKPTIDELRRLISSARDSLKSGRLPDAREAYKNAAQLKKRLQLTPEAKSKIEYDMMDLNVELRMSSIN